MLEQMPGSVILHTSTEEAHEHKCCSVRDGSTCTCC